MMRNDFFQKWIKTQFEREYICVKIRIYAA